MNSAYGRYGLLPWQKAEEPEVGAEYSLAHVIKTADPVTGKATLKALPKTHMERGTGPMAEGTAHTPKTWMRDNWGYVLAGGLILAAGIGVAAWNPKGAKVGQLRTNPKRADWLSAAGLVVGTGLIIFPEPATTATGILIVLSILGIKAVSDE